MVPTEATLLPPERLPFRFGEVIPWSSELPTSRTGESPERKVFYTSLIITWQTIPSTRLSSALHLSNPIAPQMTTLRSRLNGSLLPPESCSQAYLLRVFCTVFLSSLHTVCVMRLFGYCLWRATDEACCRIHLGPLYQHNGKNEVIYWVERGNECG